MRAQPVKRVESLLAAIMRALEGFDLGVYPHVDFQTVRSEERLPTTGIRTFKSEFSFVCFHVRPQIAYSAVSAQAAIIFAIEAIDGGLFGFRIGTVNGDGGMRGLIRHKTGITRIDVHVNLIRRYCVMDVASAFVLRVQFAQVRRILRSLIILRVPTEVDHG